MLLGFSGTGTAAHANVFDGAAESGHLMALEMGQADEDICIHDSTSDLGCFYIFTAFYRNFDIIGAL